jgi:S1-C subfamily serine protease
MIKFGEATINNLYDYTAALGLYKPGQEVEVTVKRGEENVTVKVLLGTK